MKDKEKKRVYTKWIICVPVKMLHLIHPYNKKQVLKRQMGSMWAAQVSSPHGWKWAGLIVCHLEN